MFDLSLHGMMIRIIAVTIAFSLHEAAHAFASYLLGDPTARRMGRLTLNPLAHIDPVGLMCLIFFGFGWGKPVPVNAGYYKDAKTGMIWTSFAGPLMNFVLSFVCIFLYVLLFKISFAFCMTTIGGILIEILAQTAIISAGLGIFNCIPVPPLDGSKILLSFLPDDQYFRSIESSPILGIVFIVLIVSGVLNQPLAMMQSTLIGFFSNIANMILF